MRKLLTAGSAIACLADDLSRVPAERLAQLYAELGKTEACVRMLKWLEEEDDGFDVERG